MSEATEAPPRKQVVRECRKDEIIVRLRRVGGHNKRRRVVVDIPSGEYTVEVTEGD